MQPFKTIILLGFKHAGKSVIGNALAIKLNRKFIDLDSEIEKNYFAEYKNYFTCREIFKKHGEVFFRNKETTVLEKIIQAKDVIISLGGGTALTPKNQKLITSKTLIHIYAPFEMIMKRIQMTGIPAFINEEKQLKQEWKTRQSIYNNLTSFKINNNETVEAAVNKIIHLLN